MQLFTFIMDYKGGTYISQVKAQTPRRALRIWAKSLKVEEIKGFGPTSKAELLRNLDVPVPPSELKNVWCIWPLVRGEFALVHFTSTAE